MTSRLVAQPETAPHRRRAEGWLRSLTELDWAAAGLPRFDDWDQALSTVVKLLARSAAPMALMIGHRGILVANDSAQHLFASTAGDVNGRSVLDVLPESATFYASVLESGMAGRPTHFSEQPIRLVQNGTAATHWFNLDFTPVEGADGRTLAVLGSASEVTPLVRRVRGLRESEERLHLALEESGMVGVWQHDIATGLATADANVARTYGLPPEQCQVGIAHERFLEAMHPEDRKVAADAFAGAAANGTPYRCRYRVLDGTGGMRWVMTSASPVLDDAGTPVRLLGVVVDVTGQMETAAALEQSRFHFQTLTEALPQIVWSCDGEGRHDYFSARWSEFTGIEPEDITEETWKHLVFPDHAEMVREVWSKAMSTGEPYDLDYRFRHHTGDYRWLRVMALPIRDEEGRITRWFGTSTDVHEAYQIAGERERLAAEMLRIATEDALTGLLTRRAFIERVEGLIAPRRRSRRHASLLMLDIDHFKRINDGYGHPVGDKVLATVAHRLRDAVRRQDLVGRLGGEEFAVFLPQCGRAEALEVAERVRSAMDGAPVELDDGGSVHATVSIGMTTGPEGRLSFDRLLGSADCALYAAKSAGRNRTAFAEAGSHASRRRHLPDGSSAIGLTQP